MDKNGVLVNVYEKLTTIYYFPCQDLSIIIKFRYSP